MKRHFFQTRVDKRSRESMEAYLGGHFRYFTMNGWNQASSYACNMKLYNLGLDRETTDKLYEMIQVPEFYDELHELIQAFNEAHNYLWQACWNGRSGGYLVLYQGEKRPTEYRSFCTRCGQKNYTSVSETGKRCGVCGEEARIDFLKPHMRVVTFSGRGVDQDEDFSEWSLWELQQRTALVQEFDRLADDIVAAAVHMAQTREVTEEIEYVPVSRLRLA